MDANILLNIKKGEHYRDIEQHRKYVVEAFNEICYKLKDRYSILDPLNDTEEAKELRFNIKMHDMSKFCMLEFDPYRRHFFPINDKEKEESKEDFENAWIHHYKTNKHHPEYWIDGDVIKPMPVIYIFEMIADWIAAGRRHGIESVFEWYEKNKETKVVLHEDSRKFLENVLEQLKEYNN